MRWLAVFTIALAACAAENQASGAGQGDSFEVKFNARTREEVCREIFEALRRAYLNEQASAFMAYVSRDYPRDYTTLREAVDRDCRNFDTRILDFWLDRVTSAGNDRLFDFRWEKQYDERATGRRTTARGATTFIFRQERDGYRLYDMQGDVLFGISLPEAGASIDLLIADMAAIPSAPGPVTVVVDVRNAGQIGAQKVRVRLRMTSGTNVPADQFVAVPAGRTVRVTFADQPIFFSGQGGTATVTIDPINEIVESDEFNNEASRNYPDPG